MKRNSWIIYTLMVVLTWGVWGGVSAFPTQKYSFPDQWIYIIWAITMLIPCYFTLKGKKIDFSPQSIIYGLVIGFTGAGGQLLLFKTLGMGAPAYLVFPIISISPAITVILSLVLLKERINFLGTLGIILALLSILAFSISQGDGTQVSGSLWLIFSVIICLAWGLQAFFMKRASNCNIQDSSIFFYMTLTGIILAPIAYAMIPDKSVGYPAAAYLITAATQVLNAVGALFLVMALSRGKAIIVAPCTNALAPVLTAVISLLIYQTLPTTYAFIGIILAITGSTIMVYSEEKSSIVKTQPIV
ncbi:EamA family transporter [Acerihabitans sp. TG2]|uniref:DMT family transporter n=1 Tax=Acerihabitans sp. TG2 TaxID=3096008 RepID=UPI002B23C67F|nr:EamA family transporter [Acerihabitans sp. TG2]MEA9392771.1 EamA family transporter [Acerihabitans sp. TG2]